MKPRAALLLLAPAGFFFLLSFGVPLVMAGRLSFYTSDMGREIFVGFQNYVRAFHDTGFWQSFFNVFCFVAMIAPLGIGIPYWIAVFLQRFGRRTQAAGRFISYVPSLTSGLILALLWRWLLMRGGLISQFFAHVGLPEIAWMGEPWPARVAVAMVALSGGSGLFVILFSAVIMSIPKELHDAATIDGATERQYRTMVLRPLLMPTILLALLLTIVGTMQAWEHIYVLFNTGGPKGACTTPVYEIFMTAFMYSRPNYAAAKGMLLLVVIAGVVALQKRVEKLAGADR